MNIHAAEYIPHFYHPIPSYEKIIPQSPVFYHSRPSSAFSEASSSYASSTSTNLYAESEDGVYPASRPRLVFQNTSQPQDFCARHEPHVAASYPPWQADLPHYSSLLNGPPMENGMLGREVPKWKRILEAATTLQDGGYQSSGEDLPFTLASAIVHSSDPSAAQIEFAKHVLWKATNSVQPLSEPQLDVLADITSQLAKIFQDTPGTPLRTDYRQVIGDIFTGTFISAWDNVRNPEGITYHPKPTEHMVLAAQRLGFFNVKLWQHGLITNEELQDCFAILITGFKSHEHSQALHTLFIHAGPQHWFSIHDGPRKLLEIANMMDGSHHRVRGTSSVLGKSRGDEDVARELRFIAKTCRDWVEAYQRQFYLFSAGIMPAPHLSRQQAPRRSPGF